VVTVEQTEFKSGFFKLVFKLIEVSINQGFGHGFDRPEMCRQFAILQQNMGADLTQ